MCTYHLQSSSIPFATVENVCQDFLSKLGTELKHFDGVLLKENRSKHIDQSEPTKKNQMINENSDKCKLPQAAIYLNLIGSRN